MATVRPPAPPVPQIAVGPDDAARMLGVSRGTVYALLRTGRLPSTTIGRCRRIPVAAIERLATEAP